MVGNLPQKITHWASTPDGYGGYTFATPVTLRAKWEEKTELFRAPSGEEVVSKAIVYVSVDVQNNDYLYEGVSTSTDPTTVAGSARVMRFDRTSNMAGTDWDRKAYL